jgi:transcription antitermination factor NusG
LFIFFDDRQRSALPSEWFHGSDVSVFMSTTIDSLEWYAIQVASKKEKLVASVLAEKGYECFLPVYPKRSMWSDRVKVTSVPLFAGYVFSRFDVKVRLPILVTPNVHAVIGTGKIPTAIAEEDINAIRAAIQSGFPIEPYDCLHEGDKVRVTKGPLTGIEGSFIQYRGSSRLILSVPLIQRSVAVEIDRIFVEPVSNRSVLNHRRRGETRVRTATGS